MPHRSRTLVLPALLSALFLTGCAPHQTQVPATLLRCPDQPALEGQMDDSALARWILDTMEVAEICRGNLRLVRGLLERQERP